MFLFLCSLSICDSLGFQGQVGMSGHCCQYLQKRAHWEGTGSAVVPLCGAMQRAQQPFLQCSPAFPFPFPVPLLKSCFCTSAHELQTNVFSHSFPQSIFFLSFFPIKKSQPKPPSKGRPLTECWEVENNEFSL